MSTLDQAMNYLADNSAPFPSYTNISQVYYRKAKFDDTYTVTSTGWYVIELFGYWNTTKVSVVRGNTNVTIACAQVTTSGSVGVAVAGTYLLKAGTTLSLHTGETSGYIVITKVS